MGTAEFNDGPVRASVIMCVEDGAEAVKATVTSLIEAGWDDRDELVMVDNAASDAARGFLGALEGDVVIARSDQRLPLAAARKLGASAAHGEYFVFLNSGAELTAGWLDTLMESGDSVSMMSSRTAFMAESGGALGMPAPARVTSAPPVAAGPYFPNRPPELLMVEAQIRQEVSKLPEAARHEVYTAFTTQHNGFVTSTITTDGQHVLVEQLGRTIAFPSPLPLVKYSHIACGYEEWLEHKYSLPGFVEVEAGDVVVDCGGFVGGFSLSASRSAKELHIFEPEPGNVACITRNLADAPAVAINQAGLYNATGIEHLNISESSVEHSMLQPDDGDAIDQISIQVTRLDDYCQRAAIAQLDFVKVEAEGVELEIIEGLGNVRPRKLAIDVSPERNQQSPAPEITAMLQGWGYETRQRGNVLFARFRGGT